MKNVILTLLVYLSYVVMVNASTAINIRKEDTLSKRVINGLEIVPIRTKVGCCKELETIHWKLHVPDFDKSFQKFESKYPGYIGESLTHEMVEMLAAEAVDPEEVSEAMEPAPTFDPTEAVQ